MLTGLCLFFLLSVNSQIENSLQVASMGKPVATAIADVVKGIKIQGGVEAQMGAPAQASLKSITDPAFGGSPSNGDNSSAISKAIAWEASNPGAVVYFPHGIYKYATCQRWAKSSVLTLLGEDGFGTWLDYNGSGNCSSNGDAAFYVNAGTTFTALRIENLSFSANLNPSYAFRAVQVGSPSTMDNVHFNGGSVSSFEGEFWNGQMDMRNLYVVANRQDVPSGITPSCVNGLTFTSGSLNGTKTLFASSQFTLTMPTVEFCTGTGLNMPQAYGIVINGGQLSGNHRNFLDGCTGGGCNASGNTINSMMLENPAVQDVFGNQRDMITNLISGNGGPGVLVTGSYNTIQNSQFNTGLSIAHGASFNRLINNGIFGTATDDGTGTCGDNNITAQGWTQPAKIGNTLCGSQTLMQRSR